MCKQLVLLSIENQKSPFNPTPVVFSIQNLRKSKWTFLNVSKISGKALFSDFRLFLLVTPNNLLKWTEMTLLSYFTDKRTEG